MKYQRMSHKTYEITRGIKRRLVKEVKKKENFEEEEAKNVKCCRTSKQLKEPRVNKSAVVCCLCW